jgi:hypothetical protein
MESKAYYTMVRIRAAFDETIVNRKTKDLNNGTVGAPPTPKF